jgi:hypothetical protein
MLSTNLAHRIIEANLPWERSMEVHIDNFLEQYTLHDSLWIGLFTDCGFEDTAIAVISFDPVWNSSVSNPTSVCADWPLLLLRFKCVSAISLSGYSDIGGTQRGISSVNVEHKSDEEVRTVICDHYGASVALQHFPLIDALVFLADESVRELAKN